MRKELIVFVNTGEGNEEIGMSSVSRNRNFVILSLPNGVKITANKSELVEAIKAIDDFDKTENTEVVVSNDLTPVNDLEVSYGDVE